MKKIKNMKSLFFLGSVVLVLTLLPGQSWARDRDGDGYDDKKAPVDCNDRNAAINPGATEICDDGVDNNCDGNIDAADSNCRACIDSDNDTYYAQNGCGTQVDCNDSNPDVYPGATEVCGNTVDENCNGELNEGCVNCADADEDGFFAVSGCGTAVDCNDSNAKVYPNATEVCDGVDNQCPGNSGYGFTDESCSACTDGDADGFYASSGCGTAVDCNDGSNAIYPGAVENCDNSYDDNCDGRVNEGCSIAGGDSDGDGLSDAIEQAGFELSSEFELWGGSDWVTGIITIEGNSSSAEKHLNSFRRDLFVIWRPLTSGSLIDLQACNIFEFASNPITIGGAEYQVWIIREKTGLKTATRQITVSSTQKAAILQELSSTSGTATGLSQPSSIMIDGKGLAWIKTYKISQNIDANCNGVPCSAEGISEPFYSPYTDLKCLHFKKTASHEIWHVLAALNTPDLHIADDHFVMSPSVIYTGGTCYIGDEFSASGLNDPRFQ